MDVVYPVKRGEDNEELRYSLRSLQNFPHDRVWIVGFKPSWVRNVEFIPGNLDLRNRPQNCPANILLACQHPEVSDQFTVFNDDFYVTAKVNAAPVWYRGSLRAHIASIKKNRYSWWSISLARTESVLLRAGFDDPISYELHVPLQVVKDDMRETLERYLPTNPQNPPQWRSLYGNDHQIGGVQHRDVKAPCTTKQLQRPFFSTEDMNWHSFGVQELFPNPSPYEIPRR